MVSGTWQKAKVFLSLPVNIEMAKRTSLFKSVAQELCKLFGHFLSPVSTMFGLQLFVFYSSECSNNFATPAAKKVAFYFSKL